MTTIRAAAWILIATVSAGCQHSENRYLDRQVSRQEVIGEWVATPETTHLLRDEWGLQTRTDAASNKLLLRADGTCSMQAYYGNQPPEYFNLRDGCRWELVTRDHQQIQLRAPDEALHFYFGTSIRDELALWQYADDPDQWRYIEFVRAPPATRQGTAFSTDSG